jgi:DNA polymerase I-like protein with 3'-5' exonuclease and polymerase domains
MEWLEVPLAQITLPDWGWKNTDSVFARRLEASISRHGQLRALVVRQVAEGYQLVEGRAVYEALQTLGMATAHVVNLGPVEYHAAATAALSLELCQEVNYVRLAKEVAAIVPVMGATALSAITPFSGSDIEHYITLSAGFDWSQFGEVDTGQSGLFEEEEPLEQESQAEAEMALEAELEAAPPRMVPEAPVAVATVLIPLPAAKSGFLEPPDVPEPAYEAQTPSPTRQASILEPPATPKALPLAPAAQRVIVEPPEGRSMFFHEEQSHPAGDPWVPKEPPSLEGIRDITLNFETNGLHWRQGDRPVGVAVGTLDGELHRYLPFGHRGGDNLDEAAVKRWLEREVRGKHITNANTKFDVHMSREWGVDLEAQGNTVSDVQHYAALLDDNRKRFALDILAKDYLGGIEVPRIDEARMAEYTANEAAPRAEYQVQLVAQLRTAMWLLLDKDDLQRVRQLEDDLIFPVCEMERNGAPMDVELLHKWTEETKTLVDELLWRVMQDVGFQMNPDKPLDWERLFKRFSIPITHFTDADVPQPSFTDAVLKGIDHPTVQAARRAGKIASIRSKYLLPYSEAVGTDGRLYFSLHQLRADKYGTVSGRFSASDVNIQQVMRMSSQREAFGYAGNDKTHDDEIYMIRQLFLPGSGSYLCADARQIEYRLFAHYAEPPQMLAAYAADPLTNYHKFVQAMVCKFRPGFQYDSTKTLNFMKLYGGGREHTAELLSLPRIESDAFVDAYERAFPEAKTLLNTASNLAKRRGWVKTYLGRRARFLDAKFTHKALNRVIQGTAADIMKTKIVELHRERKTTEFVMRQTVHDEVDGDTTSPKCTEMVTEILNSQAYPFKVPILWEIGTGRNWAEAK